MSILASSTPQHTEDSAETRRRRNHLKRTNGRCWYCGEPISVENCHLDHVIPKSRGGRGRPNNLVPCCQSCNCAKGPRSVEGFRETRIRQRDGSIYFTPSQKTWLAEHGFEFPATDPYHFAFETEGWA